MQSGLFTLGWIGLSAFVVWFVWRAGRSTGKTEGRMSKGLDATQKASKIQERQLHEAIDVPFDRDDLVRKLHDQGL